MIIKKWWTVYGLPESPTAPTFYGPDGEAEAIALAKRRALDDWSSRVSVVCSQVVWASEE